MALFSIQVEKHALSGLINSPQLVCEVDRFLKPKHFLAEPHSVIYSCLRELALSSSVDKVDKVLLAQKVKNLGISFKEDLDIFNYIDCISFISVTEKATISACQQLVNLGILRELSSTCNQMQEVIKKSADSPIDETVSKLDAVYGDKIKTIALDSEPAPIFDDMLSIVEERGNNPIEQIGLSTPFPEFNRLYGGLRNKNLYIIVSRAKSGKTTFLDEMASEMSRHHKIPVLILDTEMSAEEVKYRLAAAKSGVGLWYLETGNWRKNKERVHKVREGLSKVKEDYKLVYYESIGNKSIEEISSICRRWYLKFVGRGKPCLICYDYIKMMDKLSKNQQEYQLMGEKVDMLKKLSEELDCPILTAAQSNRAGITTNRNSSEVIEDESTVGISDRITWYASLVMILRRKTADEIQLDTPESGTHKLIEIVARFQGRDAPGHQDFIQRRMPDNSVKLVRNYLNFSIENFRVEERGSLIHSIQRQNAQVPINDNPDIVTEREEIQNDTL